MHTVSGINHDQLIYQIHAADTCQDGWAEVLTGIRQLLLGRLATIAKTHFPSGRGEKLVLAPACEAFAHAYATEHCVRNPWLLSSLDYVTGRIMTGTELLHPDELVRSDFYRGFLRDYDLFHRLCGVLLRDQDSAYYVAIYRARQQPAFDANDKALLEIVLRHLVLAFAKHHQLAQAGSFQQAIYRLLERWAAAVFLVDESARVVFKNQTAEQLLQQQAGLRFEEPYLKAARRMQNLALETAIKQMAEAPGATPVGSAKVITIATTTNDAPLVVAVRPVALAAIDELALSPRLAMVIVNNPAHVHEVQHCTFGRIYQLTPAQARLSSLILSGHNLSFAAQQLKVSENTVRSHLKQVFLKTDTHSQIELVHLHAKVCTD